MDVMKKRDANANKSTYGRTIIIGGSFSYPGSILLAASGALQSGVGYVTLGIEKKLYPIVACHIKEVTYEIFSSFNNKKQLNKVMSRYDSIVFGNGIENNKHTQSALKYILDKYEKRLLIDATGLEILKSVGLIELHNTKAKVMITPHMKEFSFLFDIDLMNKRAKDLSVETKKLARKYHLCIVLKDANSLITDGNSFYIITTGNAGLAHAGTGDVLAGFLGGILAYSKDSLLNIGFFGHDMFSLAAGYVAKEKSLHSIQPSDVINAIGLVLKKEKL